jgi:hypothetical protein
MPPLPTTCPSCDSPLTVARLRCDQCSTQLDGTFELPALLHLSVDDLDFVLRFVKASGSLKEMAHQQGQSYPTIRNRLNDIISQLAKDQQPEAARRQSILDAIARGTLSVAAGERKLRRLDK